MEQTSMKKNIDGNTPLIVAHRKGNENIKKTFN